MRSKPGSGQVLPTPSWPFMVMEPLSGRQLRPMESRASIPLQGQLLPTTVQSQASRTMIFEVFYVSMAMYMPDQTIMVFSFYMMKAGHPSIPQIQTLAETA